MRRGVRVTIVILLSYLVQASVLPHLKLDGVMLDLMMITLYTVGYSCGMYFGLMGGAFGALLMETASSELSGLASALCILAGAFGAWTVIRIRNYTRVGKRTLEHNVKRFAPMVLIGLFVLGKESIYLLYFYLTGMDISFRHVYKVLLSGAMAMVVSVVLLPVIFGFVRRKKQDTMFAKWRERRRIKKKPKKEKKKKQSAEQVPPMPGAMEQMEPVAATSTKKPRESALDLFTAATPKSPQMDLDALDPDFPPTEGGNDF